MAARAIAVLWMLLLSACASVQFDVSRDAPYFSIYQKRPERQVPPELVKQLDEAPACCASLATLPYQDVPAFGEISARIDARSPAFVFESGKSFFAAYRIGGLPRPFRLEVASRLAAPSDSPLTLPIFRDLVFAPELLVLDAQFRVLQRRSAGIALGDCEDLRYFADVFRQQIDIMQPALASAEYLVVMTSDAQRARDREVICGALRHGLSPVGEIVLRTTGLDFDDGSLRFETPAKWYPGKRDYRDVGLFEGALRDPGVLIAGDTALHYLEPDGHRLKRRLRIPYDAIVSLRRTGPGIDEAPDVDRKKVAVDAQGFVPGTAPYLGVAFVEAGGSGIAEHTFDISALDAAVAWMPRYDTAVALFARVQAAISPDRHVETVVLGVHGAALTVGFVGPGEGALGRIGESAMMGGIVVASPCGLCQTGACTPEMLVGCAALFSVGAAVGGVVGTGQELYDQLAGTGSRAAIPESTRQAMAPPGPTGGAAHFDQAKLAECLAQEAAALDEMPWRDQGRSARLRLMPASGSDASDDAARGKAQLGELKSAGRAYAGIAQVSRVVLVSPRTSERGEAPVAHLRVEGELTANDLRRGKAVTSRLEWSGALYPLQEWAANGATMAADELRQACRALARDALGATYKVWRGH